VTALAGDNSAASATLVLLGLGLAGLAAKRRRSASPPRYRACGDVRELLHSPI
jgi:hypothetical protein